MRLRYAISLLTILLSAACADLKDLMTLSAALQRRYDVPVNVKLSNDTHLILTFQRSPAALEKADSAGRAQFAEDVATFAKGQYPRAARLQDVTIAFSNVTSMGPITITHSDAPYTFRMEDLPSATDSTASR